MGVTAVLLATLIAAAPWTTAGAQGQQGKRKPAADAPAHVYTVEAGDTLRSISRRLLNRPGDWTTLQRINRVRSPNRLTPGSQIRIPYSLIKGESDVAVVVRGDADSLIDGKPVVVGDSVRESHVVETSEHSVVVLRLADGSTLRLEPASKLRLERLRRYHDDRAIEARALLERGRVEATAAKERPKPMSIRTPVATAAVRGTVFRVATDDVGATAEVLEGGVDWQVLRRSKGRKASTVQNIVLLPGFGSRADGATAARSEALLQAADLSQLPASIQQTHQTFSFPAVIGATAYRIEISRDNRRGDGNASNGPAPGSTQDARPETSSATSDSLATVLRRQDQTLLVSRIVNEPRVELASINDGVHHIAVRPVAANSLEGLPARVSIDVQARPLPPTVGRPLPDAVVFGDRIDFEWSTPLDIERFRIELSADPTFGRLLASEVVTGHRASLDLKAQGDQPAQRYWRIASVEADGRSGPFAQHQFVWYPGPAQPQISDSGHDRMSLRWAGQAGHRYRVQIANSPGFDDARLIEVDRPEAVIDKLKPGRYYVRVQAVAPSGEESPFNVAQMFEIKPVVLTGDGTPLRTGGGHDVESTSPTR